MSWDTEFCELFKERDNKKITVAEIGKVKSVTPLIISLFDGRVMLEPKKLHVSETIQNLINRADIDPKKLKQNDSVILMATREGQKFIVLDREV